MEASFWLNKWQKHEIGFNQQEPNRLLQRYHQELAIKQGQTVFVPLCGKSIDMLWLRQQGYQVIGVELCQQACEAFFAKHGMTPLRHEQGDFIYLEHDGIKLITGDFFKLTPSMIGKIHAVYDRAALVALPPEMRDAYAKHLLSLLDSDCPILLIATQYDQKSMQGPPFSVDSQEVERLYGAHCRIETPYAKPLKHIPEHLRAKGLKHGIEQVFLLSTI